MMLKKIAKKVKIAVFISGPPRYVNFVVDNLSKVLSELRYDCFIHLWKQDSGNKIRKGAIFDFEKLLLHPRVRVLTLQDPYTDDSYRARVGTGTKSNSPIHASMGMFLGVNTLCHYLELQPDFEDYTHILRLRTDCAILTEDFVSLLSFSEDTMTVSENYIIPRNRVSDHITFASKEKFFDLWKYKQMKEIYDVYLRGCRNPERTLEYRLKRKVLGRVKLNRSILRFKDYHIVYSPAPSHEPRWTTQMINQGKVKELFTNPQKYIDDDEVFEYNCDLLKKRPPEDESTLDVIKSNIIGTLLAIRNFKLKL